MENILALPIRHRMEFARAIDRHQYEVSPQGIVFPRQKSMIAGIYTTWINGADMQVDPNVIPAEGLNKILKNGIAVGSYIVPFTQNVTPGSTLTAANFGATLTEWTGYSEAARQAWTIPADPTGGVYSNSASPAIFTANAVATVRGAGLQTTSPKSDATGACYAASKFGTERVMAVGDKLTVQYDVSATST